MQLIPVNRTPDDDASAEGRMNCEAPYNSVECGLSTHGCNKQIKRDLTHSHLVTTVRFFLFWQSLLCNLVDWENITAGVGGTNLHGLHFDSVANRILLILCDLLFETACKSIQWRFVPPNTATSQPKFPAKGRINREAPYKSSNGNAYPQICAIQTAPARL